MNSVMEIGDYVMFIFQGRKLWEGTNQNIIDCNVQELEDFIFANNLMRAVRDKSNQSNSK